jgi:hypothetical protein
VRVLVLSSTQHKHPRGSDPWVQRTLEAIETLAREGHSFVASLGTAPWELALWKIASLGVGVHVLCPVARGCSEDDALASVEADFGLQPESCTWQLLASGGTGRLKDTWKERDAEAVRVAELLCPVSIRPGGKLETLLGKTQAAIDERFRINDARRSRAAAWGTPAAPEQAQPAGVLLHFTRASDGPWPGEKRKQYYEAIAASMDRYPRDGLATLRRIVQEKRIRASTFRLRGSARAVSFTAAKVAEALSLVRWRSRYARYSFEPYAIGVGCDAAFEAGARPVVYDNGAASGQDPFRQGRGDKGHWEAEQEWRMQGDVDLTRFDPGQVQVFTASEAEAAALRPLTPFAVHAFSRRESRR